MKLQYLYEKLKMAKVIGPIKNNLNWNLKNITTDSRLATSETLFLTNPVIPNRRLRNQNFVIDAIASGCRVIICQADEISDSTTLANFQVVFFTIDANSVDIYKVQKQIIKLFYPGVPKNIAAVTGTNGKTSIVGFTRQILGLLKLKASSIGTLGMFVENCPEFPTESIDIPPLTSFDPINFHKCLDYFSKYGVQYLACEASSHGLFQHRLDGVQYDVGVFTNFTQDHLDYHETMENYFNAKCLLFSTHLKEKIGTAIIHNSIVGDQRSKLLEICKNRQLKVVTYGCKFGDLYYTQNGESLSMSILGKNYNVNLPNFPDFQIENILAAIGIVMNFKIPYSMEEIIHTIQDLKPISGRAEYAGSSLSGGKIYVDFAHSPDSIATVLQVFRKQLNGSGSGKLRIVFGAGGNRDSGKRIHMGRAVKQYADHAIVTDDNPRNEDPGSIRAQIIEGILEEIPNCGNIGFDFTMDEIPGRKEAILHGIKCVEEGDILIIAGKGAEEYQIVGTEKIPFNDKAIVQELLMNHQKSQNFIDS